MRPTSIALAALLSAAALSANTYTVTSTADSGAGTVLSITFALPL